MEDFLKQREYFEEKTNEQTEKMSTIINEGKKLNELFSETGDLHYSQEIIGTSLFTQSSINILFLMIDLSCFKELTYYMESEKDRFEIQRTLKKLTVQYQDFVDSVIDNVRMAEFNDYRCIDWQSRLLNSLLETKSFFANL